MAWQLEAPGFALPFRQNRTLTVSQRVSVSTTALEYEPIPRDSWPVDITVDDLVL